jgi:hypothetical protein
MYRLGRSSFQPPFSSPFQNIDAYFVLGKRGLGEQERLLLEALVWRGRTSKNRHLQRRMAIKVMEGVPKNRAVQKLVLEMMFQKPALCQVEQ